MKNNEQNFSKAVRVVKEYVSAAESLLADSNAKIKAQERYKGSAGYDSDVAVIKQEATKKMTELKKTARDKIDKIGEDMKKNAFTRTTKAPTTEMVSTLQILKMLGEDVTPNDINNYMEVMKDTPIAMRVLNQIAEKNHMVIPKIDSEMMNRAADVVLYNLSNFVEGFNGNETECTASIRMLYPYFQSDMKYKEQNVTGKTVESRLWEKLVGYASPAILDNPVEANGLSVKAQYFFKDIPEMLSFMNKSMEGVEPDSKEAYGIMNEILDNCPDQYGAVYRHFLATKEILPLNEDAE